jgi:hypothetical protein
MMTDVSKCQGGKVAGGYDLAKRSGYKEWTTQPGCSGKEATNASNESWVGIIPMSNNAGWGPQHDPVAARNAGTMICRYGPSLAS